MPRVIRRPPAVNLLYNDATRILRSTADNGAIIGRVNLTRPRHSEIVKAFRTLAYDPSFSNLLLPLVFKDGSVPNAFPIGCRVETTPLPQPSHRLHIGLMSYRHPEMDYLVDLYVTRNKELAEEVTMADEEQTSFTRTVEMFLDPVLNDGAEIIVLHTGLEPMVVGFYRGVLHVLQERERRRLPRTLVFRPALLFQKREGDGQGILTPHSKGAKIEDYELEKAWW